ncbi:MAG: CBS domain-containing protein [Gaiellaceae bacterium]
MTPDTSNEQALSRMTTLQVDAMLVRDHSRNLVGVVEREDVLARLLLVTARG